MTTETPSEATEGYSGAPAGADEEAPLPETDAHGEPKGPALSPQTEARVVEVLRLMESGLFRRGASGREFARAWGVSEQRAREIVAIASRRAWAAFADPAALAAEVVPALLTALHDAVDTKDARGAAAVAGQLLEVGGLKTKKTELTGKDGGAVQVNGPFIFLPPEADE